MRDLKFNLVCDDYRVLQIPSSMSQKAKLGTMFARVEDLPDELKNWTAVNPRNPKFSKTERLSGQVARSIVKTLEEEPEKFALKNLGIYLLVESVESQRISGDRHEINITLSDKESHGIVNGGHTFGAIRQVIEQNSYDGNAFVRLHLYQNIPEQQIVDLAEGLNKNLQVDQASLKNLVKKFEPIKDAMAGKKGEKEIAYSDGELGKVDILDVLHILSVFDLEQYPGKDKHPNDIFGSKQKVLNRYCADLDNTTNPSFAKLLPKIQEILILSDEVQKECAKITSYYKIKNTEESNRVGSVDHKREAVFANGEIGGLIPQGWLYPMLSSFRANISKEAWKRGDLVWLIEPKELLSQVIGDLVEIITTAHKEQKSRPGEVGRKPTAYQLCYFTVFMKLVMDGKIGA
jgi:hypothetical protein